MKKFVYLCGMILLSLNIMAQIDLNDKNWEPVVQDSFSTSNRHFDSTFRDTIGNWIAFTMHTKSGVTKKNNFQIYQWHHSVIDGANGYLHLNSELVSNTPIRCDNRPYTLPPPTFGKNFVCDVECDSLFYYSGMIESLPAGYSFDTEYSSKVKSWPGRDRDGFFEIRCKLPIHQGAFPAFWLWDADSISPTNRYYEEIDILEFSWEFEDPNAWWQINSPFRYAGYPYSYSTGLFYNDTSTYHGATSLLSRVIPTLIDSVSNWHTYACEWMPDYVIWYCDGEVVNEFRDADHIPHHGLALKTNYAIDRYSCKTNVRQGHPPVWQGTDSMIVDYINVYQLNWDCDTDEVFAQQSDLSNFKYKVKKSIDITSSIETVKVESSDKVTLRVTDAFTITGPFQAENGGEFTVIMQSCPSID